MSLQPTSQGNIRHSDGTNVLKMEASIAHQCALFFLNNDEMGADKEMQE
jgi:hypothetical protein